MRLISHPASILLDKGVVRRVYEAQFRRAEGRLPTPEQMEATEAFAQLIQSSYSLFIAEASANVLQLRRPQFARLILNRTAVLSKGRYQRRWARRLRSFVFTREDAVIVSYGSFGQAPARNQLGVEMIVTTDFRMVTNYQTHFAAIKDRFDQMVVHLPAPYQQATLPQVITPHTILTQW